MNRSPPGSKDGNGLRGPVRNVLKNPYPDKGHERMGMKGHVPGVSIRDGKYTTFVAPLIDKSSTVKMTTSAGDTDPNHRTTKLDDGNGLGNDSTHTTQSVDAPLSEEDQNAPKVDDPLPPAPATSTNTPGQPSSYAAKLRSGTNKKTVNFRKLETLVNQEGVDIVLPKESVRIVQDRFANTLVGYFIGGKQAFPVVDYYVKTNWKRFGLQKIMMNSEGFFFFKFAEKKGMLGVLESGPWIIRNMPIILSVWSPSVKLKKEDIKEIAVWIKIHNVPIAAYTDDGLSMLATKLGTPKLLDAYTTAMCTESWGRSSYARALIEISADNEFKEELTMAIPVDDDQYIRETMHVEYEWKPPRCASCCVFGHDHDACPKIARPTTSKAAKNDADGFTEVKKKKNRTANTGVKLNKQKNKFEYRPVDPKKTPGSSGISTPSTDVANVKTSNPFDALNKETGEMEVMMEKDTNTFQASFNVTVDSDGEELIEVIDNETAAFMSSGTGGVETTKGASTPASGVSNG